VSSDPSSPASVQCVWVCDFPFCHVIISLAASKPNRIPEGGEGWSHHVNYVDLEIIDVDFGHGDNLSRYGTAILPPHAASAYLWTTRAALRNDKKKRRASQDRMPSARRGIAASATRRDLSGLGLRKVNLYCREFLIHRRSRWRHFGKIAHKLSVSPWRSGYNSNNRPNSRRSDIGGPPHRGEPGHEFPCQV
jgi:hypothetical protein